MSEHPKKRWGVFLCGLVMGVVLLAGMLAVSLIAKAKQTANQGMAASNVRQIIIAMKQYAASYGSSYPCAPQENNAFLTANGMFRVLFQEGMLTPDQERIFGCPGSRHRPDGVIGSAPEFRQALESGENHWMVLRGQTDTSLGSTPLIIESALNVSWPPRWDVSEDAGERKGCAWKGRQIIIGQNDGSVTVVDLQVDGTVNSRFWNAAGWLPEGQRAEQLVYLDIEERKTP